MGLVKVWNDNDEYDWREKFKNKEIFIKSGGFIEMEIDEAQQFLAKAPPVMKVDSNKQIMRQYQKQLRIGVDRIPNKKADNAMEWGVVTAETFICHEDGQEFATKAARDAHQKKLRAERGEEEPAPEKRGRGRPPKNQPSGSPDEAA
jgi:hypothetical protein